MLNLFKLLFISGLALFSLPSLACVSADTLCHQQREATHDITHYRTFVLPSNRYWTGNPSGYFEEQNPSDKWDPALRRDGRARKNATRMIDDEFHSLGIIKAEGAASDKIREDHLVNDVNLLVRIVEQLSRDSESMFFVEAKLKLYAPVITMHSRESRSLVIWFGTMETVYDKSDVENAIYDAVEKLLSDFSEHYTASLQYCNEEASCNSSIDRL